MPLFLLFLLVPLIEIALFIQVGGVIGLVATLAIVILTALLGATLVRSQGLAILHQLCSRIDELRDPTEPLAHGAMILFSGALLLTPGFFTDAVGFALLVPGIRNKVFEFLRARIKVQTIHAHDRSSASVDNTVIDAEYEELEPEPKDGPSGWTRH